MYRISRDHPDDAIDPSQQVAFYDAGLGTDIGATALTAPVRFVQKLLGSVMGAGIKRNIADCYEFIINHYRPGDRIFLFGFSRGAYTVRSVATHGHVKPGNPHCRTKARFDRRHGLAVPLNEVAFG
jgi:uncharacterized protein (DUF2235 family)